MIMKILPLFVFCAIAVGSRVIDGQQLALFDDSDKVPGDNPLSYCTHSNDYVLDIEQITLEPNPPKAGKNLTVSLNGTLSQPIEKGAKLRLTLKLGSFTLITKDTELCEQVESGNVTCPLNEGPVKWEKLIEIPGAVPPGKYTVIADAWSKEIGKGDEVTCLTGDVRFG